MILDPEYIAKKASRLMGLKPCPRMIIKKVKRGKAYAWQGYYTIPEWATKKHLAYAIAYIIHELAHFRMVHGKTYARHHGNEFRRIESEVAERFGFRLVYRGTAYLEEIRCLETNRVLCGRYGEPTSDTQQYDAPACLI